MRLEINDRWAAFAGALVVALFPYRVAQLAGHANGFLSFLIPLYLYFFERSLRATRRAGWVFAAGVTFFFVVAMEFHIVDHLLLLLGLYLPFRFVSPLSPRLAAREPWLAALPDRTSAALALFGGAGAGSAVYLAAERRAPFRPRRRVGCHHGGRLAPRAVRLARCLQDRGTVPDAARRGRSVGRAPCHLRRSPS